MKEKKCYALAVEIESTFTRSYKPFTEKFVEEVDYLIDEDFDWRNVYEYCSAHLEIIKDVAKKAPQTLHLEANIYLKEGKPENAKLLTPNNALRLMQTQMKNVIDRYRANIDFKCVIPFNRNYDKLLEPELPRYPSDFEANL